MDLELIDMKSLLEDHEVEISTSGKNVTRGWIEINCPFCSDPSFHLGISSKNIFSCWRCGEKGNAIKLLKALLDKSYEEVRDVLEKYTLEDDFEFKEEHRAKAEEKVVLPRSATKKMPKEAKQYLLNRNFDPQKMSSKYKLRFCGFSGEYKFRIIIPIFRNGKLVSFTSRDYTGRATIPYLTDSKSMERKLYLYNVDTVKDKAIIVEGVFDAWRFGDGAIATLGTRYSKYQVLEIARLGLKYVAVVFDDEDEAQNLAKNLALDISPYVEVVNVVRFKAGGEDPAKMCRTNEEGEEEKRALFEEYEKEGR